MLEPDIAKAIKIHKKILGKNLLRGKDGFNLLESALKSVYQTYFSEEVYKTPLEKSARLLVGIIKNHPFVDGNKRTALVLSKELLKEYGYNLRGYKKMEMVEFVEGIASSKEDFEKIYFHAVKFLEKFLVK
jgi:death-on-curing protein